MNYGFGELSSSLSTGNLQKALQVCLRQQWRVSEALADETSVVVLDISNCIQGDHHSNQNINPVAVPANISTPGVSVRNIRSHGICAIVREC